MTMTQAYWEREAGAADAPIIARLHADSWRIAYRGALSDAYLAGPIDEERLTVWRQRLTDAPADQYTVLAFVSEQPAGFICVYGGHDATWGSFVDNLHVAHTFKGQGIGARLMQSAARWSARHHPGQGMYLWVLASNVAAQAFYERIGGERVGEGMWQPPDGTELPKYRYAWRHGPGAGRELIPYAEPA